MFRIHQNTGRDGLVGYRFQTLSVCAWTSFVVQKCLGLRLCLLQLLEAVRNNQVAVAEHAVMFHHGVVVTDSDVVKADFYCNHFLW